MLGEIAAEPGPAGSNSTPPDLRTIFTPPKIEHIFDFKVQVNPELARIRGPAVPVWADLAELYWHGFLNDSPSHVMLVRRHGLVLTRRVPAHLHAWLRTSDGYWAGLVSYLVESGQGSAIPPLEIRNLVPQRVLRPRAPEERGSQTRT